MTRMETIYSWQTRYDERRLHAIAAAHELTDGALDGASVDVLVEGLLYEHCASEVDPVWADFRIDTREGARPAGEPAPEAVQPLTVSLVMPCRGAGAALFDVTPRPITNTHGSGDYFEISTMLTLGMPDDDAERFTAGIDELRSQWMRLVADAVAEANQTIASQRERTRSIVEPIVVARHRRRSLIRGAATALAIPLNRVPSGDEHLSLNRRPITLQVVEAAAAAGGNEAALADGIADDLIDLIRSFARALERLPVTAAQLLEADEETIRDVLLFILNANWHGTVAAESFIGHGKTDISLRWRDRDAFIGECKRWHGSSAFNDGVTQLLERYTVWRATRVALIVFIQDISDIGAVIAKASDVLARHERCLQRKTVGPPEAMTFFMSAQHDQRRVVTVELIPVVIPTPGQG